jgi:hypothetical protein
MVEPKLLQARVSLPVGSIDSFCRRWNVREAVPPRLRSPRGLLSGSDVDVLVAFEAKAQHSLSQDLTTWLRHQDIGAVPRYNP